MLKEPGLIFGFMYEELIAGSEGNKVFCRFKETWVFQEALHFGE